MIQTERLLIQPLSDADENEILTIFRDENVQKTYMLPDFQSEEAMKNLFLRLVALSRAENHFVRGIYLENTLIGFLNDADMRGNTIELGYVITPKHWGKGYMTEALSAVLEYLLQNGYDEVRTGAFAENLASVRVMEKCGMTKMNARAKIEYRGAIHSCVYYKKTK